MTVKATSATTLQADWSQGGDTSNILGYKLYLRKPDARKPKEFILMPTDKQYIFELLGESFPFD